MTVQQLSIKQSLKHLFCRKTLFYYLHLTLVTVIIVEATCTYICPLSHITQPTLLDWSPVTCVLFLYSLYMVNSSLDTNILQMSIKLRLSTLFYIQKGELSYQDNCQVLVINQIELFLWRSIDVAISWWKEVEILDVLDDNSIHWTSCRSVFVELLPSLQTWKMKNVSTVSNQRRKINRCWVSVEGIVQHGIPAEDTQGLGHQLLLVECSRVSAQMNVLFAVFTTSRTRHYCVVLSNNFNQL